MRISDFHGVSCRKRDRLPDTGITVANRRNPIPAFGGDEGRAIETHDAAVFSWAGFDRLFLRNSGMRRRGDAHGEDIRFVRLDNVGHVEDAADECALDGAERSAVEPDFSPVVDAFEGESDAASADIRWRVELYSIPIILFVEAFRDCEIVHPVVGIGIDAAIDHGSEHSAGNRCRHPVMGVEARLGDCWTIRICFWGGDHGPPGGERPLALSGNGKNFLRLQWLGYRGRERRFAAGHGCRILRCAIAGLRSGLDGPRL